MAMITTQTTGLTDNRYAQFYDKNLLKHAVELLQMVPVCSTFKLPMHAGTTTLRMFKRAKATAGTVETLIEGIPSNMYTNTELKPIDVPLVQYGEKVRISDVRTETDLFDQLKIESGRMGEACALKLDGLVMSEIVQNLTRKFYAGGAADFAALESAAAADSIMTCKQVLAMAQRLKKMRAPTYEGGHYVAIMTPEQIYDLENDPVWERLNVHNKGGKALYKNEVGEIYGVKILETTAGWVEDDTEGLYNPDGSIYTAVFMGREAVGTVDLAGGKSAKKPSFVYLRGADKTDPLNQFTVAGWKGYFAAKTLDSDWVMGLRTKSTMPA